MTSKPTHRKLAGYIKLEGDVTKGQALYRISQREANLASQIAKRKKKAKG